MTRYGLCARLFLGGSSDLTPWYHNLFLFCVFLCADENLIHSLISFMYQLESGISLLNCLQECEHVKPFL